jgi:hypothetical protein
MICGNCSSPVADGEQFCGSCGTEVTNAVPAAPVQAAPVAPTPEPVAAPALSTTVVATLSYNNSDYPLNEGGKLVIGRQGSAKCSPDIGDSTDAFSSTAVVVKAEGGKVTVHDTGTSLGFRVVKYVHPGESLELNPGDMLMFGTELVTVG